jgi:hypothetical protein
VLRSSAARELGPRVSRPCGSGVSRRNSRPPPGSCREIHRNTSWPSAVVMARGLHPLKGTSANR